MKILFVVPYTPSRVRTRPYHLIKALLALGHQITLATIPDRTEDLDELSGLLGPGRIIAEPLSLSRTLLNCLTAVQAGRPLQAEYSWNPALARRIENVLNTDAPDVVHVEHLRGSCYGAELLRRIRGTGATIPIVWDSVDCISHLFKQARRMSANRRSRLIAGLEETRTRRYEALLLRRFSRTVVTSEIDRQALLAISRNGSDGSSPKPPHQDQPVTVVENGVDLDYFHPATSENGTNGYARNIVFTGKMSYHANVTAVRQFSEEVLPIVRNRFPDARFLVVGKDPPAEIRRLGEPLEEISRLRRRSNTSGGVFITGTVADIRPFLWEAAVAVAPIRYGAGVQNKVLEAMGCGIPVVASRQAVGALSVRDGTDCLVADSTDEFASAVISLLERTESRQRTGTAGREYVERCHDWLASGRKLETIYQECRSEAAERGQYRSAS